jgi:hypothetical protein
MSIQLSSAELVSRIISDPSFANEIINYITNVKPKLNSLTSKMYIIEHIEAAHAEQIDEYKKILKKLHDKYIKLEASIDIKSTSSCKSCEVKAQTIQKLSSDLSECKVCESKDKLIEQLKDELEVVKQLKQQHNKVQQLDHTCKSCEDKTDIIKNMTQMLTKPCAKCEIKDEKIAKISKKKDSAIRDLSQKIVQLENINLSKDAEFEKLNKLVRLELNKAKQNQVQKQTPVQKQTQEQSQEQNQEQTQGSNSVLGELYRQFGNFISITEPK